MAIKSPVSNIDFDTLPVSTFWSETPHREIKMHKIHAYPAKFPSLVVQRSIEYAKANNIPIKTIADVFCGCGTTALEARLNNLDFWGCDINPVATLIARAKSHKYSKAMLNKYWKMILEKYHSENERFTQVLLDNERIAYWFEEAQIKDLQKLILSIKSTVPQGKYHDFFLCAFSNILKSCSRWLTKSIKPQVDPNKIPADVITSFDKQVIFMINASVEANDSLYTRKKIKIHNSNFLKYQVRRPFVDMVITSPPYATSYEYADLHQLSALWLGYTKDYRDLREGTIGSLYHKTIIDNDLDMLNGIGQDIYQELLNVDSSKAKSVAKYFVDMNHTVLNVRKMLKRNGNAIFIVGNTEYKKVKVDNAKFLVQSLMNNGFGNIQIYKRKIGSKSLTPYRDKDGKFSSNSNDRKVYDFEFVILANKN